MFRKLNALLWLRLQVLISNSTLLATLLMPFGIAILYNEFLNKSGELTMFLLSTSLTMVLSMGSGYMVYFISQGIARIAVPIFFIISGYLYFLSYKNTREKYMTKTKKRIRTLILPYLLISFLTLLCYTFVLDPLFGSYINKMANILYDPILDTLKKIFINPLPYQLWFLRDLILLTFLSPFIYVFIKYLKFYFILILIFLWFPLTSFDFFIFSNESILFFSLGAYLSTKQNIFLKKRKGYTYFFTTFIWLLILIIKSTVNMKLGINNEISDVLQKISIIIGGISVWALYDIYINKETPNSFLLSISSYSFFIYLIHEPLLLSTLKKLSNTIIRKSEFFLPFFYFLNPIITVVSCIIIAKILQRYTPKLYNFITGGR